MDILDLLNNSTTNLPIEQKDGENFRDLIKIKFKDFLLELDQVNENTIRIFNDNLDIRDYKTKVEILCEGLIETIEKYYSGNPSLAYQKLSETLEKTGIRNFLDKNLIIESFSNFYRIRNYNGNFPLSQKELFHIPFQDRGKVKTQRYSIPGLPSLYISNSIYVAWEEMGRPNFDCIQAVRLVNNRQLNLLDLTSDMYNNAVELNPNYNSWDCLYKVVSWPLVACCSVKVKNPLDIFKPEYIIPQLLLQWVNKNRIDGIKYSSTHIDLRNKKNSGHFYNVVLPVKTFNKENGYCPLLETLFSSTEVLPMQLRQFASQSDKFNTKISISTEVNKHIESICLINGTSQPYSQTYFGILEHSLNHLKTSELNIY